MTGRDQGLAVMAAIIYASRSVANPERRIRATLRRQAIKEAIELFDEVMDRDEESE